jgi:hypothetical protein
MAEPGYVSLRLRRGTTFRWSGVYKVGADAASAAAVDISGYAATACVMTPGATTFFITGDSSLTLGADGTIQLFKGATLVSPLTVGKGSWFLEWLPTGGDKSVLLSGPAEVVSEDWYQ